ncbi:MAG: DegQ family serine endoprotease [Betaproteobacteria bacterium]|nr:DegQ family serine endoprotease [Betaproteobacteria bacterium]MDE2047645.1 DegQ family serine endoprotease [Betaproteobacteria bacterium]
MIRRIAVLFSVAAMSLAVQAQGAASAPQAAPAAPLVSGLPDFTALVEKDGPGVVNIRTTERVRQGAVPGMDEDMQEFFRRFFGVPMPGPRQQPAPRGPRGDDREVPRGVGSGFIISSDGYIMTNHHVVDGADEIYVTLTDKREFKGKVIGSDERTDVAIVKIDATNLPALRMGDVSKLKVGEWVVAIGSPFGLDNTVTAGIVSAKQRDTGDYLPFIQTDVAVNPGNSGGPLLNMRGEVVGINSQIYSRTGQFAGVSFAIPIDQAMRVGDQLRATGKVSRGRLGVRIGEVGKDVADSLGLPKAQGALVTQVERDSPADKAGIEAGDVILKFDGKTVERASDLPRAVGNTKPGSKATVEVWRKGKARDLSVVVAEMEPDRVAARGDNNDGGNAARAKPDATKAPLGLVVKDLTDAQRRDLRLKGGVVVEASDGRSAIRSGDLVLAVQDTDITDAKQFATVVKALDKAKAVRLLVRRGDLSQWIIVRPTTPAK